MVRTIAVLICFILPAQLMSQKVDCSGVTEFWNIYNILRQDHEPDSAQWNKLFETPGYAEIQKREKKRNIITRAFRIAFKPSLKLQLDTLNKKEDYLAWMLKHLIQIPSQEIALKKYQSFIEKEFSLQGASKTVAKLLPADIVNGYDPPPVSAIIFAADGRGYSTRIVFDMLHVMHKKNYDEFFAHEYFHFYYGKISKRVNESSEEDEALTQRLYYMAEEGLADMNDKRKIPSMKENELTVINPDGYLSRYKGAYLNAEETIRLLNELLEKINANPQLRKEYGERINKEMLLDGRPVGAYMANAILEVLGIEKFHQAVKNVFEFYKLYNIAAKASNKTHLSDKAMAVINELEQKYLKI
jgi:hypothetical protein